MTENARSRPDVGSRALPDLSPDTVQQAADALKVIALRTRFRAFACDLRELCDPDLVPIRRLAETHEFADVLEQLARKAA